MLSASTMVQAHVHCTMYIPLVIYIILAIIIVNIAGMATSLIGCPRMVRGDRGVENSTVAFMQPFLRRNGTDGLSDQNSFQYGRSASNQVCTNLFTIDLKN